MGDPSKLIGGCNSAQIQRQNEIENILGTDLPYCAKISAPEEGGIHAIVTGTRHTTIKEVDSNGSVYYTTKCSQELLGITAYGMPLCINAQRVKQSNTVDPSKVAEARARLLKEKKPETAQPEKAETQPTVVQKNP